MKCLKSLDNPRFQVRQLLQQANRFCNLALLLLVLLIATPLIMFVAKVRGQSGGSSFAALLFYSSLTDHATMWLLWSPACY